MPSAPFARAGAAGFELTGDIGCNELAAEFEVTRLARDALGGVMDLEAIFSQRCDGSPRALRGSVQYRARPG